MEVRLRTQIENEWKDKMDAARKREVRIQSKFFNLKFQQETLKQRRQRL